MDSDDDSEEDDDIETQMFEDKINGKRERDLLIN